MHFEYIKAKSFLGDLLEDLSRHDIKAADGSVHRLSGLLLTLENTGNGNGTFDRALNTTHSVILRDMTLLRLDLHMEVGDEIKARNSAFLTITETKCIYNETNEGEERINETFKTWQDAYQRLLKWRGMPQQL